MCEPGRQILDPDLAPVKIRYISRTSGKPNGPEVTVAAGMMGSIASDTEGNLHVVYTATEGGLYYKLITTK